MKVKYLGVGLLLFLLAIQTVGAAPDGDQAPIGQKSSWAQYEDVPFWRGQVTHDMISPKTNLFLGQYDGQAYDLASEFNLETWGYDELYDNNAANLTANPAEIDFTSWNTSGLIREPETSDIDDGEWAETDAASLLTTSIAKTAGGTYAPDALHMVYSASNVASSSAYLHTNFANAISLDKYLVVGLKINSETVNATTMEFNINMWEEREATGEYLQVRMYEDATDGGFQVSASAYERVRFDMDDDDVIMYVAKLSTLDGYNSEVTMSGISSMRIHFTTSAAHSGIINVDIFALDFLDSAPYFGDDEGDVISDSPTDHVVFNASDPSSPDLTIVAEKLNSKVDSIEDGTVDFVSFMETSNVDIYEDTNRINYVYDPIIDQSDDGIVNSAVTWSSLTARMMLGGSEADYLSIKWEGTESKSLVLNEEQGDFITLASSLAEDTYYHLETLIQYTDSEFEFIISGNSASSTPWYFQPFTIVLGGIAAALAKIGLGGPSKSVNKTKTRFQKKTVRKQKFKPKRR